MRTPQQAVHRSSGRPRRPGRHGPGPGAVPLLLLLVLPGRAEAQTTVQATLQPTMTPQAEAYQPQLSLRFVERGTVPRRVLNTGTAVSSRPAGVGPGRTAGPGRTLAPRTAPITPVTPAADVLIGRTDLPFALPGRRAVNLNDLRAGSVLVSDQVNRPLSTPGRDIVVRPLRGAFDLNIGRIDASAPMKAAASVGVSSAAFSSDVSPLATRFMTFSNMLKDSKLEVTISRAELNAAPAGVDQDHSDFPATNIVITSNSPGLQVEQIATSAQTTTYAVTATTDQLAGSIEFAPSPDIEMLPRTLMRQLPYADRTYPRSTDRRLLALNDDTTDYTRMFSPFTPQTPLDFRWAPFIKTNFPDVGLTPLRLGGKELRVFTFPDHSVIDPAQLAWTSRLGKLFKRSEPPSSVWQQKLTSAFCRTINMRTRTAGLQGDASISTSGSNVGLFGATGDCYFSGLYHEGTDFIVPSGTTVYSVMAGRVHTSGYWAKAGGHVGIIVGEFRPKNAAGLGPFYLELQYLHLNHCQFRFRPDQSIQAGERLGVTAARGGGECRTEYSPHLHIDAAVVYYEKNVMHKFYFDSLLFLNQAGAFGTQLTALAQAGGDGSDSTPDTTPPDTTPPDTTSTGGTTDAQPAPVFTHWAFSGCTPSGGSEVALSPGVPQRCRLVIDSIPNGLKVKEAVFSYSLSYTEGGAGRGSRVGTTALLPGTDRWRAAGTGNTVSFEEHGGTLAFLLPIQVKQGSTRRYTAVHVYGQLTFANGAKKRIYEPLPIAPPAR